jgi:mannose-6-phosphate isomerase-like protein (cupin superfamily)
MLPTGTVLDIGDHSVEVVGNPETHDDRYLLRIDADPGGPGIAGDFPHIHPSLVETFRCVSGNMVAKVGRSTREVAVGEKIEVAEGEVHGFLNTGTDQLIIESEVIFPNGYDQSLDLMHFAEVYDRLKKERPVNKKTGEPPLLQMAVLTHSWSRVIKQPGFAGFLMPALYAVGKLTGYRSNPFEDRSAAHT